MGTGLFSRVHKPVLTPEQRARFHNSLPQKVYKTERNIAVIVAGTQLLMMLGTVLTKGNPLADPDAAEYFFMYLFLFLSTVCLVPVHGYLVRTKHYRLYLWLRRLYVIILYAWVIGMTYLDKKGGMGIVIYCYLLPTLAAVMLQPPIESVLIFVGSWVSLVGMLAVAGYGNLMADCINSAFTAILALFISVRGYQSMAVSFRDGEIIHLQYVEIEKANVELNQMAYTDQLTGLFSRRFLIENVIGPFTHYQRLNIYATVIMIDIDNFKQYNDNLGHLSGDACLHQIGGLIAEFCRKNSMAAVRYGGEEFLVMDFIGEYEESGKAQQIQEVIWSADIVRPDVPKGRVTVSIGVWSGYLGEIESFETALKYADQALYDAKRAGRDCIRQYKG